MEYLRYNDFVRLLAKKPEHIIADLTPDSAHLLHMAVGVSGESGELLDAIKKSAIYNKPLDKDNVLEELGDLMFYMQGIMNTLNFSWEDLQDTNRKKLATRYSKLTYSNEAAQARADKV
jgi:NTP pyrophosphatase (non-canonical NTP hydrolase)